MAIVKAFCGIRPRPDLANHIAALPYDVFNREEAYGEVHKEPLSFLRIDRAETQFSKDIDTYDSRVYEKAKELLWGMVENGEFVQDQTPSYYIYELTMGLHVQTGLVACSSIDDYQQGIIKKHENTREEKELDRICHVDICDAQTGPIFLTYRANRFLNECISREKQELPIYDFIAEDGIRHRVWTVQGAQTEKIEETFREIEQIYIADGHHRAASAVKVGLKRRQETPDYTGNEEFNYFLSVLFPDDQLKIMDYNRVVKDLNGQSVPEFLEKVSECFEIEAFQDMQVSPKEKGIFGMYLDKLWYRLKIKKEYRSEDPVTGLDVSILQNYLLSPVLGIADPKTDKRIDFVGGIRGLSELERRVEQDCKVAFSLYPTSIRELFSVADAGKLMPPKSTWFEPKLRSGLFIHALK